MFGLIVLETVVFTFSNLLFSFSSKNLDQWFLAFECNFSHFRLMKSNIDPKNLAQILQMYSKKTNKHTNNKVTIREEVGKM